MKINRPTLLIDKNKCLSNIELMADKAGKHNLKFRPHFKTHNLVEIGNWFRDFGVDTITVSSVEMAQRFIKAGWEDITIAFPFNIREIPVINRIHKDVKINLLVDSVETAKILAEKLKKKCGIFIEMDTGYRRTGVPFQNHSIIHEILDFIGKAPNLDFKGFLIHAGENYAAKNTEEILSNHNKNIRLLNELRQEFKPVKPDLIISIGDTPGCSIADTFEGVDEIRPGNFVFYDVMQYELGACSFDQIAVAVACPVVGVYKDRSEAAVHCGAIHLSKESLIMQDNRKIFGLVAEFTGNGWNQQLKDCYVSSISQEHGILHLSDDFISKLSVGDTVCILPVHSCLTAAAMKKYMIR